MYKIKNFHRTMTALLVGASLSVFADDASVVDNAKDAAIETGQAVQQTTTDAVTGTGKAIKKTTKDAINETGKAVNKAGKKVEKAAKDAGEYVADGAITTQVKAKLAAESDIPSAQISVTTTDGVVALSGTVDTRLQADKAIEVASSVRGVKDVNDSKLDVTSSDSFFSDAAITAKAKGKIMQLTSDRRIADTHDLHVETTNGVVHVYGTVAKNADVRAIKDAISSIPDVKDVKTNIKAGR